MACGCTFSGSERQGSPSTFLMFSCIIFHVFQFIGRVQQHTLFLCVFKTSRFHSHPAVLHSQPDPLHSQPASLHSQLAALHSQPAPLISRISRPRRSVSRPRRSIARPRRSIARPRRRIARPPLLCHTTHWADGQLKIHLFQYRPF